MLIGASGGRWRPNSSGPMPATSSPRRRNCRRSKPRSPTACPKTLLPRPPPTRRKKTARAAETRDCRGCSAMPVLSDEARAKVNLTLRVNGRRADGYHDLESVVAFADCADRLTLTPGPDLDLKMLGPLAAACGDTSDNLVLKAARLLAERVSNMKAGSFSLDKVLPVAAGIGGGSADAAAALRLLAKLNGLALDDVRIIEVARLTGADVPVCVNSLGCVMSGVGETLEPLSLPTMPC